MSEKEQNLRILSGALGYYIFSTDFPKLPLYKFNCFLDPILFIYLFFIGKNNFIEKGILSV